MNHWEVATHRKHFELKLMIQLKKIGIPRKPAPQRLKHEQKNYEMFPHRMLDSVWIKVRWSRRALERVFSRTLSRHFLHAELTGMNLFYKWGRKKIGKYANWLPRIETRKTLRKSAKIYSQKGKKYECKTVNWETLKLR